MPRVGVCAMRRRSQKGIGRELRGRFEGLITNPLPDYWLKLLERIEETERADAADRPFFVHPLDIEQAWEGLQEQGFHPADFVFAGHNERARVTRTSTARFREYETLSSDSWWTIFLQDLRAGCFNR